MIKVRKILQHCDDCPNTKFNMCTEVVKHREEELIGSNGVPLLANTTEVEYVVVKRKAHPLVCHNQGGDVCNSRLRILRCASTHYPVLVKLLLHVTDAKASSQIIQDIDKAIKTANFIKLTNLIGLSSLVSLLEIGPARDQTGHL